MGQFSRLYVKKKYSKKLNVTFLGKPLFNFPQKFLHSKDIFGFLTTKKLNVTFLGKPLRIMEFIKSEKRQDKLVNDGNVYTFEKFVSFEIPTLVLIELFFRRSTVRAIYSPAIHKTHAVRALNVLNVHSS